MTHDRNWLANPDGCSHVLFWIHPGLVVGGDGFWELLTLDDMEAGRPAASDDDTLDGPCDEPAAALGEWAARRTGRPVTLTPGTLDVSLPWWQARFPHGRQREVPVYYITPAP